MTDDSVGNKVTIQSKKNTQPDKKQSKFAKFFGIKQKETTEEEILEIADDAKETGAIDESTRKLIERVLDFSNTNAGEIMTHRTEMTVIEDTQSLSDLVALAIESGHSRIPVYSEDIDNVTGAVHVKDLLKYVGSDDTEGIKITNIMRPVLFVPGAKVCSELFSEMTSKKTPLAIVIDEYGGTEGLITMEDLLETIVGNIQDEYDDEKEAVIQIDDNKFTVEGSTDIEELEEVLGCELPREDCETVAGLILEGLGGFPDEKDNPSVKVGNVILTAEEVEDRRITKVTVEIEN